jgi:hypothetical protein
VVAIIVIVIIVAAIIVIVIIGVVFNVAWPFILVMAVQIIDGGLNHKGAADQGEKEGS